MLGKLFNSWFHVAEPELRESLERPQKMESLLRQCLPIVEREALGTRPTKETWELLEAIKKAVG